MTDKAAEIASKTLENVKFATVKEFVDACGGTTVIEKVLISNNGIAAVKAIRSIRKWAYTLFGEERKIQFLAMATPEDLKANAEYIRMADAVTEVPGGANNNNYANVALIVNLAQHHKCDAVWAGWGHASENPLLPASLAKANIVFIGPASKPMHALGDKIGSTIIAQSAGVSTIAWNGDGIKVSYQEKGEIPQEAYDRANVKTVEDAKRICKEIGFPLMIKASEGGGGKGIRKVLQQEDVETAYRQIQGEVPGSPIFIMKLAKNARHLEVQLLADQYGNAIALSGRDCSVQRRHQKIIEEGPPLAPSPEVWQTMERAAVSLAKEVGYANAGTVEYLFMPDGTYAFLELNPRLQVEHPVTEMVTGVNLPACQLCVAMGLPLVRIPQIRTLYGRKPFGTELFDPDEEKQNPPNGHVIACRITAENPDQGFRPTSGSLQELNFRSTRDVWGYFSVDSSGRVHEFADSQIGHLFAWGSSREYARKNMVQALKECSIRGDIRTTVQYLVNLLETPDFIGYNINTAWLDKRIKDHANVRIGGHLKHVVLAAASQSYDSIASRTENFLGYLRRGQLPPSELLVLEQKLELIYDDVKYSVTTLRTAPTAFEVIINDSVANVDVRVLADGGKLLLLGTESHVAYGQETPAGYRMEIDAKTYIFTKEYDPTRIRAEMSGKLARYLVDNGATVSKGTAFAEVEVMKMFLSLRVPEDGVVTHVKPAGSVMEAGDLIARLSLRDPSKVKRAEVFTGKVPSEWSSPPLTEGVSPLYALRFAKGNLQRCVDGFVVHEALAESSLDHLLKACENTQLPAEELTEALSVLSGRIPEDLHVSFTKATASLASGGSLTSSQLFEKVTEIIQVHKDFAGLSTAEETALDTSLQPIVAIANQYRGGSGGRALHELLPLLDAYFQVEKVFNANKTEIEEAVRILREARGEDDLRAVYLEVLSHESLKQKNKLILSILKKLPAVAPSNPLQTSRSDALRNLSSLNSGTDYNAVAHAARQMIITENVPSFHARRERILKVLEEKSVSPNEADFATLVESSEDNTEILLSLLRESDSPPASAPIRAVALEVYVRRVYRPYLVDQVNVLPRSVHGVNVAQLFFRDPKADVVTKPPTPTGGPRSSGSPIAKLPTIKPQIARVSSLDHLSSLVEGSPRSPRDSIEHIQIHEEGDLPTQRCGVFLCVKDFSQLKLSLQKVCQLLSSHQKRPVGGTPWNVIHVLINIDALSQAARADDGKAVSELTDVLRPANAILNKAGIRRVTFVVISAPPAAGHRVSESAFSRLYTFRANLMFNEDAIVRHIEPPLAYHLELHRLSNFGIRAESSIHQEVHLYAASAKASHVRDTRYFARALVRSVQTLAELTLLGGSCPSSKYADATSAAVERVFVHSLDALEPPMSKQKGRSGSNKKRNHIFINVLPESSLPSNTVADLLRDLHERYHKRLVRLGVVQTELKVNVILSPGAAPTVVRLLAVNPTGFAVRVESYIETSLPRTGQWVFSAVSGTTPTYSDTGSFSKGSLDMKPVDSYCYPVLDRLAARRERAAAVGTVFAYDFLHLFSQALRERVWANHTDPPAKVMDAVELVVGENDELWEVSKPPGMNEIGMVAWRLTLFTPEYPQAEGGRTVVLIANDITFKVGTFGTKEDRLFEKASEFARVNGYPRLYFAANSGARIGLAEELKSVFKVDWVDDADPSKGFHEIYLEPDAYRQHQKSVNAVKKTITKDGVQEDRYVVTDIIGAGTDIGVENLRGSGGIAGETSRAYRDSFTLTYVTARCVGIGAYLVRLGQRTIQKAQNSPIILTGHAALNKLIGKKVYTSNMQLGGPGVMYANGVSHMVVSNDLDGVSACLTWLSYVPKKRGAPLPVLSSLVGKNRDVPERDVQFQPIKGAYDPRFLLSGCRPSEAPSPSQETTNQDWVHGFFDRDSFTETLSGWAQTVVTGRARLGGIPIGVVVTESRTMNRTIPADPANPTSVEVKQQQPGGVWFPDSAFKTAQAIQDFGKEGLPLIIFANWRGFSGGQRDMFDEILKFGSIIVDALVEYDMPIFVYIPPHAELRGGAWVVVDETINIRHMEMYAAPDSRGNVLEPSGAVSIRFKKKQVNLAAHRLDKTLVALDTALEGACDPQQRADLEKKVLAREEQVSTVFLQVATHFADLHDKPGRMLAKGVIRQIVPLKSSRRFFYCRLKRKLEERKAIQQIQRVDPQIDWKRAIGMLSRWFQDGTGHSRDAWKTDNESVTRWFSEAKHAINRRLVALDEQVVTRRVKKLASKDPQAAVKGILAVLQELPADQREQAAIELRRGMMFLGPAESVSSVHAGSQPRGALRSLGSSFAASRDRVFYE